MGIFDMGGMRGTGNWPPSRGTGRWPGRGRGPKLR